MSALKQVGTTRVYAESAGGPAFLMFVLNAALADAPADISTADAWSIPSYAGWFVVLPCVPQVPLEQLAQALLASPYFDAPAHTSLAWTCVTDGAVAEPCVLRLREIGQSICTDGAGQIGFGRYGIMLPDGITVTASSELGDLKALTLSYSAQAGWPAPAVAGCQIPFAGGQRFCVRALGLIGDTSAAHISGQDISLRYLVRGPGGPRSIRYGLFDDAAQSGMHQLVDGTIDPLTTWWSSSCSWPMRTSYALTGQQYCLSWQDGAWSIALAESTVLRSCFRTVTGAVIDLRPVQASYVPQPLCDGSGGWYLTPCGSFQMSTTENEASGQLLCGLVATEFVTFRQGDFISFYPNSPADAGQFGLQSGSASRSREGRSRSASQTTLEPTTVTAWVAILPGASGQVPTFHAQPLTAATYAQSPAQYAARPGVAPLYSPLVASLVSTSEAPITFPMVPHVALDDAQFGYSEFEQHILAPARMQAIIAAASGAGPATSPYPSDLTTAAASTSTTTPQGFLVAVAGTQWSQLQLACNTDSDGNLDVIGISAVTPTLRLALQSRSLFLVGTLANPFATLQPKMSIADWPFSLNIGDKDANGYRNVAIFKFCTGRLLDLGKDHGMWTNAAQFNADPDDVASWIGNYFEAARDAAQTNVRYQNFLDILEQEDWNGILVLRVDVPVSELPDDLRGLAAGIDSSQFAAHHFGITSTPVQQSPGGGFQMPSSSALFGLINYVAQDTAPSTVQRSRMRAATSASPQSDPGYVFRVLTLFAEFASSQIVGFDSQIVLTMTQFFGEDAQLQNDPDAGGQRNAVTLFGSLEKRIAADGSSVALYVFETDSDARYLLPTSPIFNYVDVAKVDFNTLKPQSKTDTAVQSQFCLSGYFNFGITGGLDLLSFGDGAPPPDPGSPPAGLAYANLIVKMGFDSSNPQATLHFHFDPSQVSFDIGSSSAPRANSLAAGLPLTLGTILTDASGTPSNCGYLPVLASQLTGVAPLDTANWYALSLVLSLGTPGALAAISSFNATLIAAWSPGYGGIPGQPQAMVSLFIQLPGTAPGKSEFSLQEVLKLSIDQIVLTAPTLDTLVLTFTNIGLTVLGKKLPSGAVIDIALLGGDTPGSSLGWMGSYSKPASQQEAV